MDFYYLNLLSKAKFQQRINYLYSVNSQSRTKQGHWTRTAENLVWCHSSDKDWFNYLFWQQSGSHSQQSNYIRGSLSTLNEHVAQLEQRVGANEDNLDVLSTSVKQLEKSNSYMLDKVEDLENRRRTLNLCFVGIHESAESRDVLGFMAHLIPQLLGNDNFTTPVAIERAHHTPTVRQTDRSSPRHILIRLLHFQDKVKILWLAWGKKDRGEVRLIFDIQTFAKREI